nr:hypothetical protein [Paenibacillus xylanexedens]
MIHFFRKLVEKIGLGGNETLRERIDPTIAVVSRFFGFPSSKGKSGDKGERFASSDSISFPPLRLPNHRIF